MPPLKIGQHIAYVLLPRDLPVDPDFEYHGVIIGIEGTRIHVELTDPQYLGYDEWILVQQIRRIEGEENR
jgi:hypothetical protein